MEATYAHDASWPPSDPVSNITTNTRTWRPRSNPDRLWGRSTGYLKRTETAVTVDLCADARPGWHARLEHDGRLSRVRRPWSGAVYYRQLQGFLWHCRHQWQCDANQHQNRRATSLPFNDAD